MHVHHERPFIESKKLTRIYPLGAVDVVGIKDIDLRIPAGELVVLKGNSGSGKSTLLALLAGLDTPTQGQLRVAGQDLQKATPAELNRYRRETVGVVFQTFNLLPTLTVLENICLPALLAGKPDKDVHPRALDSLDWLNLSTRAHHYPAQLSGGEMQRTAIARALINQPSLILADEPTGNLDSMNGRAVVELLAELNHRLGRTVILATHSNLADSYATRRLCLKDGTITDSAA
jgi:putative ABC transport system ATP-binding protein